jgi:heparan-alpha-glucosaminide N-acetyltransferase
VIDVWEVWSGSPLFYAGMNSIVLYVGHEMCEGYFPLDWVPYTSGHAELLFMNVWGAACWILVSYRLYKANWFISV